MSQTSTATQFIPLIPLNSSIFTKIREDLPADLEKESPDVYRQLQLQSLLYVTFNQYLTDLILHLPETNSEKLFNDLMNITDEQELTQALADELNKPFIQLINNYLELFKKINKKVNK